MELEERVVVQVSAVQRADVELGRPAGMSRIRSILAGGDCQARQMQIRACEMVGQISMSAHILIWTAGGRLRTWSVLNLCAAEQQWQVVLSRDEAGPIQATPEYSRPSSTDQICSTLATFNGEEDIERNGLWPLRFWSSTPTPWLVAINIILAPWLTTRSGERGKADGRESLAVARQSLPPS